MKVAHCGISQPPQLCEPIPHNKYLSIYPLSFWRTLITVSFLNHYRKKKSLEDFKSEIKCICPGRDICTWVLSRNSPMQVPFLLFCIFLLFCTHIGGKKWCYTSGNLQHLLSGLPLASLPSSTIYCLHRNQNDACKIKTLVLNPQLKNSSMASHCFSGKFQCLKMDYKPCMIGLTL